MKLSSEELMKAYRGMHDSRIRGTRAQGVLRASRKVVEIDGKFLSRLTLPLSLVYDHRVIDGAVGARFLALVRERLMDPGSLSAS